MIISFCTTCMNRLDFIKLTLLKNLQVIESFNNKQNNYKFEISLCNYDSKDDLDIYINNNFKRYIDSNILIYIKVDNKKFFNISHAKNIAHKYSNGDILVNIDADNFITEEYIIKYILGFMIKNKNTIIVSNTTMGKISLYRDVFLDIDGYNENLIGYGYDDIDLINRCMKYHKLKKIVSINKYDLFINHDIETKMSNYENKDFHNNLERNQEIMNFYLKNNIKKVNEYNNIIFGSI